MKRISQFVAFVVVGLAGLTGTAFAHAEFDPATAVAGSGTNLNISVPNEHATANTIKVELLIPVE